MGIREVLLMLAVSASIAGAASAEELVVLKAGRVVVRGGKLIENGHVVMGGGKIRSVGGAELQVSGAEAIKLIDLGDVTLMAGLVDGFTHVGLIEIGAVAVTRDHDESVTPLTPQVHAADGLNVGSSLFRITRMNGTTTVLAAPAEGNLVSGSSCLIALEGDRVPDLLRKPHAALHASLGAPPMRRFGEKERSPSTRMGEVAMLRQALVKAREYQRKWERHRSKKPPEEDDEEDDEDAEKGPPDRDLEQEAWLPVLTRKIPLVVRAQRLSDIQSAVRLSEEFGFRLVLLRAAEAWRMANELAAKKIDVLYGPVTQQPSTMETLGARYDAPAILHRAGVRFAIVSADTHNARNLPYEAGIAVAHGLPMDAAIDAITLVPAQILGLGDKLGSLEIGKDADVIVLDGDVIQPRTRVLRMWIRGREVELTSRQTELADRYR